MNEKAAEKRGILLVAFGTSIPEARVSLDRVGEAAVKRFPDIEIRWAYTSSFIRRKLARQGEILESPENALKQMKEAGFTHVAVQSLHVAAGSEYHDLARTVSKFRTGADAFEQIVLGKPLLLRSREVAKVVDAILASVPARTADDAVILMGHGNEHGNGEMAFVATAALFQKADSKAFLGTVEGQPDLEDVLEQCRETKPKRAFLVPFMLVAGDHARNDLAGSGDDSWQSQIEKLGIECVPVFRGMGEIPGVVEVWMDHLEQALAKMETD